MTETIKPPELLEAQVAAYTAEAVPEVHDSDFVLRNLGRIVSSEIADVGRVLDEDEFLISERSPENPRGKVEEGTNRTILDTGGYLDFLRQNRGSRYEEIRDRAEALGAYSDFKPAVDKLKAELDELDFRSDHPDHLGSGTNSEVFAVEHNKTLYAVRLPKGKEIQPVAIDNHLAASSLAKGMDNMEHVAAASYEDGVTITRVMSGELSVNLQTVNLEAIPDRHIESLLDTLVEAHNRGIYIDPKATNFFYDRELGFQVIDFHSSKVARVKQYTKEQSLGDVIGGAHEVIGEFSESIYNSDQPKTVESVAEEKKSKQARLRFMRRYQSAAEARFGDSAEMRKANGLLNKRIGELEAVIGSYDDPEKVAEMIDTYNRGLASKQELKAKIRAGEQTPHGPTTIPVDLV